MSKLIYICCSLLILTACSKNGCDNLPDQFSSFDEVGRKIETTEFFISEVIRTPESSWIHGASFYSCDGNLGYLKIETDHQNYYHEGVSRQMWDEFKSSDSKGKFYNENIRNNFQLLVADE
jgi:hypothetical protein